MRRALIVLAAAAVCSGCLRSTTVISVKPDGSGTIVQETGFSQAALSMLRGIAEGAAAGAGAKDQAKMPTELFGEEQAKKAAAQMGVQYVSGEPFKTAEMEGYRARFAFADVRKLKMKFSGDPSAGIGRGSSGASSPFGFDFERRAASSVLTIAVPEPKLGESPMGAMPGLSGQGSTPEENQQALTMMRVMMQGLLVDISLEVDGRIVKTNAAHVEGSRVTLLNLDFDKLLADESALARLQKATDLKALSSVPGLKILASPTITIEFAK